VIPNVREFPLRSAMLRTPILIYLYLYLYIETTSYHRTRHSPYTVWILSNANLQRRWTGVSAAVGKKGETYAGRVLSHCIRPADYM